MKDPKRRAPLTSDELEATTKLAEHFAGDDEPFHIFCAFVVRLLRERAQLRRKLARTKASLAARPT